MTTFLLYAFSASGPFQNLNAEDIDQDLGDMFRTMYKLTKVFADQPAPRNASDRMRRHMEKFKLHQPLLNIICNPGIRDRHWTTVSGNKNADKWWE